MTVIRPNSIAGITSITAQDQHFTFHTSDGTTIGQLNANINASSGVSTIANLSVTGIATFTTVNATSYIGVPPGFNELDAALFN